MVEFSDARLVLHVRDTPPTEPADPSRILWSDVSDPISGELELIPNNDASTTLVDHSAVVAAMRQHATTSMPPHSSIAALALPTKTIETGPIRFDGWPEPQDCVPARSGSTRPLETYCAPLKVEGRPSSGDTTAFDVPLLRASMPVIEQPLHRAHAALVPKAAFPNTTDSPRRATIGKFAVIRSTLTQLGALAKRRPVAVAAGATAGSLVIEFFLVGLVNSLGIGAHRTTMQTMAARPAVSVAAAASVVSSSETAAQAVASSAIAKRPAPVVAVAQPSALASPAATADFNPVASLDATTAVNHVLSGRLAEAEAAYRDLAARFPDQAAFSAASRILSRRNAPICRGPRVTKTSCPTVKP